VKKREFYRQGGKGAKDGKTKRYLNGFDFLGGLGVLAVKLF
jgi:hypothetical protein